MFYTRFLSPADHKCAESSTYWQFFYYRPPRKFRWTSVNHFDKQREISLKCDAKNLHVSLSIYIYLLLLISMLWHRQAIFESIGDKLSSSAEWRIRTHQGLRHQIASRLNARWQTDWAIEDQAKKLEFDSPSLWSASIQPTWPHCHLAFAPGSGDIHICCC